MSPIKLVRSLRWRLRCLLGSPHEISMFHLPTGGWIYYPFRSQIGYALFRGTFEAAELSFLRKALQEGDTLIDIGANAGIFTITAAQIIGNNGKIFAYEPADLESSLLQLNIRQNLLSNVAVEKLGVSDKEGEADFVISADGAMNSLARTEHRNQQPIGKARIRTTTLNAILSRPDIGRLRFIKIDTEGAERQIILPALARLRAFPGVQILFESQDVNNRGFGYTTVNFLKELQAAGGKLSQLDDSGHTSSVDLANPEVGNSIYNFVLSVE